MAEVWQGAAEELWAVLDDPQRPWYERLRASQDLRDLLRRVAPMLARKARSEGCTWSEIAAALGITKQAAQQRYG